MKHEKHGMNKGAGEQPTTGWRWRGRLWLEGGEGTFLGYGPAGADQGAWFSGASRQVHGDVL